MAELRRIGVTRRWSDVVIHQGTAYFVEVADDMTANTASQIEQVLNQADRRLASFGSDRKSLIQVLIYLADIRDAVLLNEHWDAWIPEGHAPSRACVQATLGHPDLRIELVITAAVARE